MDHKLSVTVQVDLDGKYIRIVATGCLTEISQRGLHPLIGRARDLVPGIHVTVDLSGVRHVEAAGVGLLRQAIDHDDVRSGTVELVVPAPSPEHWPAAEAPAPDAHERTGAGDPRETAAA